MAELTPNQAHPLQVNKLVSNLTCELDLLGREASWQPYGSQVYFQVSRLEDQQVLGCVSQQPSFQFLQISVSCCLSLGCHGLAFQCSCGLQSRSVKPLTRCFVRALHLGTLESFHWRVSKV